MEDNISKYFSLTHYAVAGASRRKDKYGYKVMRDLIVRGKEVYPIHPAISDIDGIKVYSKLSELPLVPDAIHFITSPQVTERVAKEAVELGIKYAWMQPGAESDEAIRILEEGGATVIHDTCIFLQS